MVHRDINIIVENFYHAEQQAKRKQWVGLGRAHHPQAFSPGGFGQAILVGMADVLDRPTEFVALLRTEIIGSLPVYSLICQHAAITDSIANRTRRMTLDALHPVPDVDAAKARHQEEVGRILSGYTLTGRVDFSQTLNCHRFRCDPRSKTLSITPFQPRSTKPQDYPDRLATTSEFLEYLAALFSSNLILDLGDPFWIKDHRWIKFSADFMDNRSIDFAKVRVNLDDPEDWDYVNTDFDYEIRR